MRGCGALKAESSDPAKWLVGEVQEKHLHQGYKLSSRQPESDCAMRATGVKRMGRTCVVILLMPSNGLLSSAVHKASFVGIDGIACLTMRKVLAQIQEKSRRVRLSVHGAMAA